MTTFAERVYAVVERVPCGKVITYGQVAMLAGQPKGARAVGNIMHANPYAPPLIPDPAQKRIVPCHRVVGADGRMGANYGLGGPAVQRRRLEGEGVLFLPGTDRVDLSRCGVDISLFI